MKTCSLLFLLFSIFLSGFSQTVLFSGHQPQMTVDPKGIIRLIYGETDKIYFSSSTDKGKTFTTPIIVGLVRDMHLGMTRGPQLATSKAFSVVSAMDKKGNIHCFRLNHNTGKWERMQNINDVGSSAPEGLMSIAADEKDNFFAVWLDLREGRQNNLCFSILRGNSNWEKNRIIYKSPDGHVCECCKPAIAVRGSNVSIMFRNWLRGSRDCYLTASLNGGQTFATAQKLGAGTWILNACPMDGGGLVIDKNDQIHTAWRREGQVYYAEPGKAEIKAGEGKNVGVSGNILFWQRGSDLIIKPIIGKEQKIGEGTALQVFDCDDQSILAVWEQNNQIKFKSLQE